VIGDRLCSLRQSVRRIAKRNFPFRIPQVQGLGTSLKGMWPAATLRVDPDG
jgi:hypothetical protein